MTDEWLEESKKEFQFVPRPAVERRSSSSYVPEIALGGRQVVVGKPEKTLAEADAVAKKFAEDVRKAMLLVGMGMIKDLKEAK